MVLPFDTIARQGSSEFGLKDCANLLFLPYQFMPKRVSNAHRAYLQHWMSLYFIQRIPGASLSARVGNGEQAFLRRGLRVHGARSYFKRSHSQILQLGARFTWQSLLWLVRRVPCIPTRVCSCGLQGML